MMRGRLARFASRGFTASLVGGVVLCGSAVARGADEPAAAKAPAQDKLSRVVAQATKDLDSADWTTRDAARQRLHELLIRPLAEIEARLAGAFDRNRQIALADELGATALPGLRALEASLQTPGLSPEQTEALSTLAYQLFSRSPRAAMGVSFAGARGGMAVPGEALAPAGGVMIGGPVAGFDSQRVFQPGDVLRRINDVQVADDLDARVAIVGFDPGQTVEVEFVRAGEVRTDTLTLGDFSKLANTRQLDEMTLRRAWRLRGDRLRAAAGVAAPQAIALPGNLSSFELALQRDRVAAQRARSPQAPSTLANAVAPLNVDAGGSSRVVRTAPDDFSLSVDDASNPHRESIQQLTKLIAGIDQQVRQIEAQLRDPNLNPANRQRFRNNLDNLRRLREGHVTQRRELRAKGVEDALTPDDETSAVDEKNDR